jgi:hypothetical protein
MKLQWVVLISLLSGIFQFAHADEEVLTVSTKRLTLATATKY